MVWMYCKKIFGYIIVGLTFVGDIVLTPVEALIAISIAAYAGIGRSICKFVFSPDAWKYKYYMAKCLYYTIIDDYEKWEDNLEVISKMVEKYVEKV